MHTTYSVIDICLLRDLAGMSNFEKSIGNNIILTFLYIIQYIDVNIIFT